MYTITKHDFWNLETQKGTFFGFVFLYPKGQKNLQYRSGNRDGHKWHKDDLRQFRRILC